MKSLDRVYRPKLDSPESALSAIELRNRWTADKKAQLRLAIAGGTSLPQIFPKISISFAGRSLEVDDLRGAPLEGMDIQEYDLAYCALDHANFEHSRLTKTRLQYSTLIAVSFRSATLDRVQASPIDASLGDFTAARLIGCHFSHSNLDGITADGVQNEGSDFVEASNSWVKAKEEIPNAVFAKDEQIYKIVSKVGIVGSKSPNKSPIATWVGHEKIGTVLPKHKSEFATVSVLGPKKSIIAGKSTRRHQIYKILGSIEAFSVGDTVAIHQVEIDRKKIFSNSGRSKQLKKKAYSTNMAGWLIVKRSEDEDTAFADL